MIAAVVMVVIVGVVGIEVAVLIFVVDVDIFDASGVLAFSGLFSGVVALPTTLSISADVSSATATVKVAGAGG